ncbi:uncharacterized protein STEHIDRAFT_118318 [Stereum hirsutum FP-91666 SS1]|uniref:uncharacterized protein n=1 Tax=Stereum hirsutum (strain FP-91666) TaxID=721885 RepID=UPI00044106EB|nr:uncharacterized protein STEHIDRAFT_118318 [Stereum hirsutum FP-91666 SS1]EIM91198.1 hypothetical protein STEHIDRAFT_118318 [Stereum hirsutum FP-91666 SS1]
MQTHVIFTATAQFIDFVQVDGTRLMRKPEVLPGDVDQYPPEAVPHCTTKWTPNILLQWLLTHKVDRSKYEFHPSGSGSGAWCVAILAGLDNNGVLRTGTSKALQWVVEQCSTKAVIPDKVGLWIG